AAVALLDRDAAAIRRSEVDGRRRRGDVERDVVLARDERNRVRADLVRGVSVRRDAIRADDDEVDAAVTHEGRRHALGDDRRVDPVANELPGGEPRALEKRTGLVGKDGDT